MVPLDDAAREEDKSVLVVTVIGGDAERLHERASWQRMGVVPNYGVPCGAA